MSVDPFPQANTFVAYMDIMGFKSMMQDQNRGPLALDAFYSTGYSVLKELRRHPTGDPLVDGFFVSDCGVLFVRGETEPAPVRLECLCRVVQKIHRLTFNHAVQLATSIVWGEFSYNERIEFPGIDKNEIYGNAYVEAFADNESGKSKLYPSECRLVRDHLPQEVDDRCSQKQGPIFRWMRATPHYFYYEWMRQFNPNDVP